MSGTFVNRRFKPLALLALGALASPVTLFGQSGDWSPKEVLAKESYVRPPAVIERLVDAPRQTNVSLTNLSPDRKFFLDTRSAGLPTLQSFGKAHYYFAGLQVDFKANRARALTTRGSAGLTVVDAATGKTRSIEIPKGATVSAPEWSPDATRIAFIANFDDASRLYVADLATGKSKQLVATPLLATLVTQVAWSADGKSLFTVLIPDNRGVEPKRPEIETGPLVRLTDPAKNPQRVFASLLRDPFEKAQMKYFVTGQLAIVDAKTGTVKKVGGPGMISGADASPDGKYVRVTVMQEPFSYIVPYGNFGQVEQVWDTEGTVVAELAKRPLRTGDSGDGFGPPGAAADSGARGFAWMPNGQGLSYLKQDPAPARAGGDTSDAPRGPNAARRKDKLYQWLPPFTKGSEKVLLESDNRIGGVLFSEDASLAFVAENTTGTGHVYAAYFNEPAKKYTIWRLRGINASVGSGGFGFGGGGGRGGTGDDSVTFYQNPGNLVTKTGTMGRDVAQISADGRYAFLRGTKYFKDWETQAPRGFVDKVEIKTGQKARLFEGTADVFESVTASLDDDMTRMVVTRESPTMVPNAVLRNGSGAAVSLTTNADPTPEFTKALRKRVRVTRSDGITFVVNLTLPADYRDGTRLPAMLWLYPYEYTDQSGYDRTLRSENINRFPQGGPRTIEFLVLQGYAVANFSPPVIGSSGRMNDNYVSDLQRNLIAVIDELDRQGFIDRTRLGIGGHSYGAFTTVNALVHTPYFKAGIAGDGMYNRTLTPFNFQSERRDFFEAQQTYLEMSPFLQADKLQGALLMYHSIEDQNVGTAPISSERMMHVLEGLGKTASLYMYPYEDHGPAARETLLDQWARWTAWLDVHVKNATTPALPKVTSEQ
ncbi:MAG: prolyl oligopeptidase family serine peptidase [Gemmatimonadaceae bacterium]